MGAADIGVACMALVDQFHGLAERAEHDRVFADVVAGADRVHADLLGGPFADQAFTAMLNCEIVPHDLLDDLRERIAARCRWANPS